ncbi:MAG: patatin-like phospholipase family protein, partial [Cytophagales bacterium]|nr:patatin-like phospholipase family protein [Cytophagales bacterium]
MRKLFRACIFALGCITAVVITYVAVAFIYSSYIVNYEYELTGWPDETEFGDPMPWKTEYPGKVRILAIQGGALHGLADLEILKTLEERSGKRIHELFDFFAGTSTGAVVSALLLDPDAKTGQPVTAHEAIEIYEKFSKDILDTPLHHTVLTGFGMLGPMMQNRGRFDAADVVFGDTRFNELLRPAMFPSFS